MKTTVEIPDAKDPPLWMEAFGGLRELHRENRRISKMIEEEFETIDH